MARTLRLNVQLAGTDELQATYLTRKQQQCAVWVTRT